MLKLILILLLLPVATIMADPVELGVMTFNVRYGTARDLGNSWPNRRDTLVAAIEKYSPDIIGTQECLEFQAEYIEEKLPEYRWFGIGREKRGTGEMTAVLYKYKEVAPIETGTFWLSEEQDVPGSMSWDTSITRIVTWAKFLHRDSGTIFFFGNTHFDHRGQEAREKSAELLVEEVQALPAAAPVILVGDFNSIAEESAPWKTLTAEALKDAWLHAEEKAGPATTWGGWLPPDEGANRRIDWILYRGPLEPRLCETVTYNEEGRYPSDHLPVYCRFEMAAPEKKGAEAAGS